MTIPAVVGLVVGVVGLVGALGAFILGWGKRKPEKSSLIAKAAENAVQAISESLEAVRAELETANSDRARLQKEVSSLRSELAKTHQTVLALQTQLVELKRHLPLTIAVTMTPQEGGADDETSD